MFTDWASVQRLGAGVGGRDGAGGEIRVVERPDLDLTVGDVSRIYTRDRDDIVLLLSVTQISSMWKRWDEDWMERTERRRAETTAPGLLA